MLWLWISLGVLAAAAVITPLAIHLHVLRNYIPFVVRIFQEKPLFILPFGQPVRDAENVTLTTPDGLALQGCYLKTPGPRKGVLLFGLEFGSNRWSCVPYCEFLRDAGYDIFAFETRGQGDSPAQSGYEPLQWVTDFELIDFQTALAYLKTRPDKHPRGIGFFGLSKGGSAGLMAAAGDDFIRCCVVDGAFAAVTTMLPYMKQWVVIYAKALWFARLIPFWYLRIAARVAMRRIERIRDVHYPSLETCMPKLAPRPLLMIHGGADNYIKPDMARVLFSMAGDPKEFWLVDKAKHNQAITLFPEDYKTRVLAFFDRHLADAPPPHASNGALVPTTRDTMLQWLLRNVILKLVAIPVRRRLRAFEEATNHPREVQEALLARILRQQTPTAFGRDHHFATMNTVADYRRNIPVRGYDYVEPYLKRVLKGETNALLADRKIHMFAMTSGTTATRKYIPVTDQYLADYRRGWNIWGLKVFRDHAEVRMRPIVQMSGDWQEFYTETGIPCGAVTGLTAQMQMAIIRWIYCIPAIVGKIKDPAAKYYLALRLSIPRRAGMIIAANPSTLVNMARAGDQEKETLLRDIHDGTLSDRFDIPQEVRAAVQRRISKRNLERSRELEAIVNQSGTFYPRDYWPKNCIIGNWMGGSVALYLRHFPKYYGETPIRDVGLIASEGRMTIPMADGTPSGALDVTSHFFEFIPEEEGDSPNPTVLSAHELQEGRTYYILLTTAYGLYRYNIFDVVRCTGFFNKTPLVEFLSKGAHFANITGEKVSEYHVTGAMADVLARMNLTLTAYSIAPCWDDEMPFYGLFVERPDLASREQGVRLTQELEKRLGEVNSEYASKRETQRLGAMRLFLLPANGWREWDRQRLARTGGTLEQYKHPCLIPDPKFRDSLAGAEEVLMQAT